jgi:mannan endo-1,4-beta-mannosidase
MGFDLGRIELGSEKNIDNVSFEKIRQEIIRQYQRGGMITMSWHVNNPLTDGDSWDVKSGGNAVVSVLPGGQCHDKFLRWLQRAADFFNSLKTEDGTKIPIVFRPWHEHTGSWFWWGKDLCSSEQYKTLWRMTSERLRLKGVNNVLLAYSPGMESDTVEEYLERYPGDDIIDVLGTDVYQYERSQYIKQLNKMLTILTEAGKKHDKPIALTETGFEGIPDSLWWTGTLLPVIEKYPLSYVLVWRNAREKSTHYYAPYPGQVSADDFVRFSQSPKMLFAGDDFELYK